MAEAASRRRPRTQANNGNGSAATADNYIVILQPTVKPDEILNTVLKGHKPGFVYGTIFVGFSVDRLVPLLVLEVRLDPRVLTVVEDRASMGLSREVLMETLQSGYTVVNRDTGEIYDMGELDGSAPYRYSILPSGIQVPTKARTLLGINQTKTCVPNKAAKVMGHFGGVTHVRMAEGDMPISGKAARMLGIQPMRKAASHASVLEEAASWRESAKRRSTSSGPVPPLQRRRPEDDGDDWGYAPSPIRHVSFAAEAQQRQPQRQQQAAAPPPPAAPVFTISRKRTPEGQPVVSPTNGAAAEMPAALWRKQSRSQGELSEPEVGAE